MGWQSRSGADTSGSRFENSCLPGAGGTRQRWIFYDSEAGNTGAIRMQFRTISIGLRAGKSFARVETAWCDLALPRAWFVITWRLCVCSGLALREGDTNHRDLAASVCRSLARVPGLATRCGRENDNHI